MKEQVESIVSNIARIVTREHTEFFGTDKPIMPECLETTRKRKGLFIFSDIEYYWVNTHTKHYDKTAGPSITATFLFKHRDDFNKQVAVWLLALEQEMSYNFNRLDGWYDCYNMYKLISPELRQILDFHGWPYHHKSKGFTRGSFDITLFRGPQAHYQLAELLAMCISHVTTHWKLMKIISS